jgi:hypothetical protein
MPTKFEDLEEQVLALPAEDRARLVERLIASFDPVVDSGQDGLQVALRRRDAFRLGRARMLPAEEALARAWAQLG